MTYTPPEGVSIGAFTADTLPASFNAPAGAVVSYKIYGTSEGAGVETESGEPAGYKIPILLESRNLFDYTANDTDNGFVDNCFLKNDNTFAEINTWCVSEYIPVIGGTKYVWRWYSGDTVTAEAPSIVFYNTDKQRLSASLSIRYQNRASFEFEAPLSAAYIRASVFKSEQSNAYLKKQSNYDLFIGSTKLREEEYLDYGEQKIYKMSGSALVPTDPPAPLPPIPTYKGENTLSSTETLGEVEFNGDWLAIMGSTEDESIDIEFTVDAEEYIAFVTVDDDPQIQVSDTITMPSSADSFTLEVVSWGRERYTETVYNALA